MTNRDDKQDTMLRLPTTAVLTADTLRNATGYCQETPSISRAEDKLPVFWRVFGGTMLSISALVCITVYQQFNNGINDLRKDMNGQHEARGDMVRKDELTTRLAPMWNGIKEATAANAEITGLKERCAMLQEQVKAAENDRKQLCSEVQQLRDRLVRLETRQEPKAQ